MIYNMIFEKVLYLQIFINKNRNIIKNLIKIYWDFIRVNYRI